MTNPKTHLLTLAILLAASSANSGSITREVTFNFRTVTALNLSGDLEFNLDNLVAGDGIYTIEDIVLNYDNGAENTAGGTRTVMCTVSADSGVTFTNADGDNGGSPLEITLTSNSENLDTQILYLDFDSLCGDGSSTSQSNTLTIIGTIDENSDANALYSSLLNNRVIIKASYVPKSGISLNDDLDEPDSII